MCGPLTSLKELGRGLAKVLVIDVGVGRIATIVCNGIYIAEARISEALEISEVPRHWQASLQVSNKIVWYLLYGKSVSVIYVSSTRFHGVIKNRMV